MGLTHTQKRLLGILTYEWMTPTKIAELSGIKNAGSVANMLRVLQDYGYVEKRSLGKPPGGKWELFEWRADVKAL
jgi:DNA-binding IclR family transcriptional regulator